MTPIEFYTPDYDFSAKADSLTLPIPDGITYWMWNTEIRAYDADRLPEPLCKKEWSALRISADSDQPVIENVKIEWPRLTKVVHTQGGKSVMNLVMLRSTGHICAGDS